MPWDTHRSLFHLRFNGNLNFPPLQTHRGILCHPHLPRQAILQSDIVDRSFLPLPPHQLLFRVLLSPSLGIQSLWSKKIAIKAQPVSRGNAIYHSNSSPEDWPSGYVRLERVKGVEERKWKANKWVWRSIGVVQHEGYAAEKRTCMGIRQGCTSRTCSVEQPLLHDECVASSYHYNYARVTETTLVWEHFGDHSTHSRPPGGKLSKFEEDEVDLQVLRKHEATAHELRTGDTGPGSTPFPDISPTLANPNAARYALGQSQARLGMVTTSSKGDLALMGGFADLGKRLSTPFIVDASVSGPVYITLQTPSMDGIIRECVESWILDLADGPSAGRHGILVDGDHSFFRVGPLIYLVQCIYVSEEDL
ncbi:hypothetical protein B0H13DRAFT_2334509 [Mycena leptocephala]|nr:hypothetical protein B0H13DRAFT_2334509 [Mycena leptocephala]